MQFQCDSTSRTPIYRQLIHQVREALARGRVEPGEQLPSVRQLSRELVVNPNTVARAYTELERVGILYTRPGLGVFVAKPRSELASAAREERLSTAIDSCLTEAVHLGYTADETTTEFTHRIGKFRFATDPPTHPSTDPSKDQ